MRWSVYVLNYCNLLLDACWNNHLLKTTLCVQPLQDIGDGFLGTFQTKIPVL